PRGEYRRPLYFDCFRAAVRARISRLIAISGTTARDLCRFWAIPANRVAVVPLGTRLPVLSERRTPPPDDRPVLLARYSIGLQKNFATFLRAVARVREEFSGLRLVLFGFGGGTPQQHTDANRPVEELGLSPATEQHGFVPDEKLDELYRGATVYVLPSIYEGFGLPLLEAMARGVCVVAHGDGAMAEVVGRSGWLIDVRSVDSLTAGLTDL